MVSALDPGAAAGISNPPGGPTGGPAATANASSSAALPAVAEQAAAASAVSVQGVQGAQSAHAAEPSPSSLQKAVQKINQQLAQSSGVTLSAGLDTTGAHPGQVLVELSDKATRQTFFKYYIPASQVVKAAQNLGGSASSTVPQGTLISAKA